MGQEAGALVCAIVAEVLQKYLCIAPKLLSESRI